MKFFPAALCLCALPFLSPAPASTPQQAARPAPADASGWKGKWIWLKGTENERNFYLYARKMFDLAAVPKSAKLRLTADSRYKLWVNGRYVARGPVRSDPAWWYFDTHDISAYLHPGRNVVAVLTNHYGDGTFQYIPAPAGLLAEIQLDSLTLPSDGTWKVQRADGYRQDLPKMSLQLPAMEEFDARKEPVGWLLPTYDDSKWEAATTLGPAGMAPKVNLIPRDIPFLREGEYLPPARLKMIREVIAPGPSRYLDLLPHMEPKTQGEAYAAAYLLSPKRQKVTISFGADDGYKLWVGGKRVVSKHRHGAARPDLEKVTVDVPAGATPVVAKVHQETSAWELYFRAVGEDGKPIPLSSDGKEPAKRGEPDWWIIGPFDNPEEGEGQKGAGGFDVAYPPESELDFAKTYQGKGGQVAWKRVVSVDRETPVWERMGTEELIPLEANNVTGNVVTPGQPWPQRGRINVGFGSRRPVAILIDMGRERIGFPRIRVRANAGVKIDMGYSELLEDDRVNPNRADVHYADRYITREGVNEFETFTQRAYRYLQIDITPVQAIDEVVIEEVSLNYCTYPAANRGGFTCSDKLLNDIWNLGRHTTLQCMEDAYTDCPWRERGQWWGDARAEAYTTYYAFGDTRLIRKAILQIGQGQFPDGITPGVWPADFADRRLPDFCLIWVMTLDDYALFSGDTKFVAQMYPKIVKSLSWFDKHRDVDGILRDVPHWVFIDWADLDKKGASGALNAFYIGALQAAERLANRLNKPAEAADYRRKWSQLSQKLNDKFWSDEEGAYVDAVYNDGAQSKTISEQTNALFSLYRIADAGRSRRLFDRIRQDAPKKTVRCGSPYFSFYLLWAMNQAGRHLEAIGYIRTMWKRILDEGATTAWEMWGTGASLCHGWSSGPTSLLPMYVLGVQPVGDGLKRISIAPQTLDLSSATGYIPSPQGEIRVSWKKDGRRFTMTVDLPEGVTADVTLPVDYKAVLVNGKPAQGLARTETDLRFSLTAAPKTTQFVVVADSK